MFKNKFKKKRLNQNKNLKPLKRQVKTSKILCNKILIQATEKVTQISEL